MVELLEIEHECMLRGAHDDCDRNCADCELVQDDGDLHEMYTNVIALLKEQEWQTKRLTPTEPKVTINAYGTRFYYCPHCARPLMKSGIKGEPRHCVDCGQAVKRDG